MHRIRSPSDRTPTNSLRSSTTESTLACVSTSSSAAACSVESDRMRAARRFMMSAIRIDALAPLAGSAQIVPLGPSRRLEWSRQNDLAARQAQGATATRDEGDLAGGRDREDSVGATRERGVRQQEDGAAVADA